MRGQEGSIILLLLFFIWSVLIVDGWGLVGRGRKSHSHLDSWCYSRKRGRGIGPRFHFVVLVWIKIIRSQDESKIPLCSTSDEKILLRAPASYNKLLGRVARRILPNMYDWVPPRKQPTVLRHSLFPQKKHYRSRKFQT